MSVWLYMCRNCGRYGCCRFNEYFSVVYVSNIYIFLKYVCGFMMVTVIIMTMMIITAITGEDKDDNGYIGNGKNKD